jgi:hypothetical protein
MNKKLKFEDGTPVSYWSQGRMEDMRATKVIGYNDTVPNKNRGGRMENRYVILHYHGWWPSHQEHTGLVRKDLSLEYQRRHAFAFESEMKEIKTQYKV